ncbi:MAG TPA: aromatic hydrocarbon degradation protein [Nitrospiraceae bacterium]|nr:aromatic hydrocarbon degradation protein [Nitrospiraceae bacterium]
MKRDFHTAILISFLILVFTTISATSLYATNGHQLSAIGAYQQGMAGATTAAPYDATTAVSNPAGMAMIGTRTDFSFQTFFPSREVSFAGDGTSGGGSNWYLVPAIGWTAPTDDRQDLFFGGGMYGVSGMGVDYDTVAAYTGMFGAGTQAHIWSQYQFWKMAPTVAWKNEKLALGFALNLDYQAFGFEHYFTNGGAKLFGFDLGEMQGALGLGAAVGFIYTPVPTFSVGASYTSKQYFTDFKWRLSANDVVSQTGQTSQDGIYTMSLDFPQQAAVGIAIRPIRNFLWTLDVKWIQYSDTYDVVKLKGAFGGTGGTETDLPFGWDDVWVYATGFQFDITPKFAFRLGYNHSSSPIKEEDVENNVAFPAIVEDRVAGGFTYRLGRHWEITMAYMHAMREQLTGLFGTTISLEEEAFDFELSYRF